MFEMKQQWDATTVQDAFLLGVTSNQLTSLFRKVDGCLSGQLQELATQMAQTKKIGDFISVPTLGKTQTKWLYLIYLGENYNGDQHDLRLYIGKIGQALQQNQLETVGVDVDSFLGSAPVDDVLFCIGEALSLSQYEKHHYKEAEEGAQTKIVSVALYGESLEKNGVFFAERGYTYGQGTNMARHLVNTPANKMTPTDLEDVAVDLAMKHAFEYEVLDEEEMHRLGMGALLGVAQGSSQPAKLIVLRYEGNPKDDCVTAFVGKGLTFDSGGYSLKPSAGMHEMKGDMGGAAAVLGAMDIIGAEKPAANVLAVIPSSENLINGEAMKPGDVLHSLSGKTIEVRNTDAEGRLILADALTYAKQLGATRLIDVATLTGACIVALGHETTGAVTNDEDFMCKLCQAGAEMGEPIWQFPSGKAYEKLLKTSDVADLNNAPGRPAGSITAGLFLGAFVEETPWVHLDIAGTSWLEKGTPLGPAGATGVMARTLAHHIIRANK
ncbi:leucyl aminopeptidase [Bacillus sp. FSL W7-1360]